MPDPGVGSDVSRSILVIDEDPQVGRLIRLTLSSPTCKVSVSPRIEDGLRQAARQKPSLIIMEARFKAAEGIPFASKILKAPGTSNCSVIVLTSDLSLHRRMQALQAGVIEYLDKPLGGQVLVAKVEEVFERIDAGFAPPRCGPLAKRLLETINTIESTELSCNLWLTSGEQEAELSFSAGTLSLAKVGDLQGLVAFDKIARHGDWEFTSDAASLLEDTLRPEEGFDDTFYDEDERTLLDSRPPALVLDEIDSITPLVDHPQDETLEQISLLPKTQPELELAPSLAPSLNETPSPALLGPSTRSHSKASAAAPEVVGRDEITQWLQQTQHPPLIVALSDAQVRTEVKSRAGANGFNVVAVDSALNAYEATRSEQAAAVIADTLLPDATGQDLLSAVRSDFLVRETPFIIISSTDLASRLSGNGALDPILHGLDRALTPRVQLWSQLAHEGEAEGWVERVGVSYLLQLLGMAKFSGHLLLNYGEQRNAEAIFNQGAICGVTVNAPQPSVGPLAMLHLVGYEWSNFLISHGEAGVKVPLGELKTLVEVACRQNNTLLQRTFKEGLNIEEVSVERSSLDSYLRTLPASSLSVLLQLVEGESGAAIAKTGVSPALLKALLHDMRRKGVIRVGSLKPVRSDKDQRWASLPSPTTQPKRSRRWLVVLLTTLITVATATGGYLLYRQLSKPANNPVSEKQP